MIEHPLQAAVGLLSLFVLVERSLTHRYPTFDPRVRVWSCTSSYALRQEGPCTGRQSPSCTHCIAGSIRRIRGQHQCWGPVAQRHQPSSSTAVLESGRRQAINWPCQGHDGHSHKSCAAALHHDNNCCSVRSGASSTVLAQGAACHASERGVATRVGHHSGHGTKRECVGRRVRDAVLRRWSRQVPFLVRGASRRGIRSIGGCLHSAGEVRDE